MALVLVASIAVFLFWNGALWRAAPGASHVGRIAVSYLVVPPLLALVLAALRRLQTRAWLTDVGAVWAAKLLVTSSLYYVLAPGTSTEYAPVETWRGVGTADNVVQTGDVAPTGRNLAIDIGPRGFATAAYAGKPGDRLVVQNVDTALHTLRIADGTTTLSNSPLPPGGGARVLEAPTRPGIYTLSCATHAEESARLVIEANEGVP